MNTLPKSVWSVEHLVRTAIEDDSEFNKANYAILSFDSLDDRLVAFKMFKKQFDPRWWSTGLQQNELRFNRRGITEYAGLKEDAEYDPLLTVTIKIPSRFELFLVYYVNRGF